MTNAIELAKTHRVERRSFRSFVFINDSSLKPNTLLIDQLRFTSDSNLLSQANIGCPYTVSQIYAPKTIIHQLRTFQFKPNEKIKLVSKTEGASVIIDIKGKLIGLGAKIAQRIVVTGVNHTKS
ncbi:MAG: FeoA family protein [Cyanobacteria bacterium P01_A01_bin.40]